MSVVNAVLDTLNSLKLDGSSAAGSSQLEPENLETAEKLRVFCSLPTVAANLGQFETREKLVPTISELVTNAINAGDDEVLLVIAQKLGTFAELVGGKDYAACLLPILEKIISMVEEVVVAQAACDSLVEIIPKLPREDIEEKCVGMIRRILDEDLYCSSRKVTAKLITICCPLVSPKLQMDLKYRIFHLADSDDEVPLVRAAAVHQLVDLAKHFGAEIKTELCLLLTSLVSDNQRVVRAACVEPLIELGRLTADPNDFDSSVRPCIDKLAADPTRDTRRALASSITELQQVACSFGGSTRSLHQIMLNLLEDNEVETRRIATTRFKGFCLASPKDILSSTLLPQLREHLFVEREEPVRAELVRCSVALLPFINRTDALPLVQHILAFLNDTSSQPESCARETVLPANLSWLRDPSWYVRECACRSLARLLRVFPGLCKDTINGFGQKATLAAPQTTCSLSTGTSANSTTVTPSGSAPVTGTSANLSTTNAVGNQPTGGENTSGPNSSSNPLGTTATNFVSAVTAQAAAGGLKALAADANYHVRQIYISAIQTLWGPGIPDESPYSSTDDCSGLGICLPGARNAYLATGIRNPSSTNPSVPACCQSPPQLPAVHLSSCATQLLRLAVDDVVANVRICAVQALQLISGVLDKKFVQKEVIPVLRRITENDSDVDVRYYAQETLIVFTTA
ncbi:unnamed protein product [Dicrocoelium dendriticum]|nr:unnamed protein product [Dicrocoelium dendriticum]